MSSGTRPESEGQFEARKREHLRHSLDSAHQAVGFSGLDRMHLVHEALPDLDFSELDLSTECLGRPLSTPFYVAGMTAGHPDATRINGRLVRACARRGWAMGVGSQRRELESGRLSDEWAEWAPGQARSGPIRPVLFANFGIAQVIGHSPDRARTIAENLDAVAVAVHLNGLQEVLQPEGTPSFRGGLDRLTAWVRELAPMPVIVKETGCGISGATVDRLLQAGVAVIDVSGLGGTHWGRIEGARADRLRADAARVFGDWGESTVDSTLAAVRAGARVWASGGVRTGLDAAKLLALGASRIGYAVPALQAALAGEEELDFWMESQEFQLKTAMFCTGSRRVVDLWGKAVLK